MKDEAGLMDATEHIATAINAFQQRMRDRCGGTTSIGGAIFILIPSFECDLMCSGRVIIAAAQLCAMCTRVSNRKLNREQANYAVDLRGE